MRYLPGFLFRSIRIKFALLVLVLTFVVFSISSGVLILRSINTQTRNLVSQARAFASLSAKPVGDTYNLYYGSGYLKFAELIKQNLDLNSDVERVKIVSVNGKVLFDSVQLGNDQKQSQEQAESDSVILEKVRSNSAGEIGGETARPRLIIEPYFEDFGAHPFSVLYFVSYDSISSNILDTVITTVLLSLIFFVLIILLIIFVVNKAIINPIEVVIGGARKIKSGELSHKIEVRTNDEVAELAEAVNSMAQTLKKNIEDLKEMDKLKDEFVFLASHNLRTPLTVIKGYIGNLQKDSSLDTKAKKELGYIEQSSKELEDISESLINLVSLEKDKRPLLAAEVNIPDILQKIGEGLATKAAEKKISFIFEFPSTPLPRVSADPERISQAFTNLLDNAVKFNKETGKVIVRAQKADGGIQISVQDTGIGISEKEKDKVFQKFHRATDTLTYDYEGVGLGLYLTKLIIEAHLGRIWFESKLGEGTTFFVKLPVKAIRSVG